MPSQKQTRGARETAMNRFYYYAILSIRCLLLLPAFFHALSLAAMADETSAMIAVFNDTESPDGGAWEDGLDGIRAMLDYYGYAHEDLTPEDLNTADSLNSRYDAIIFGGGWAGGYNTTITSQGFETIRNFVADGGGYFGICAGAYLAANVVVWKPDWASPMEVYIYKLHLFNGAGVGTMLSIIPWNGATGCPATITEGAVATTITLNTEEFPDMDSELDILYYGGPALFSWPNSGQKPSIRVVAWYQLPVGEMGAGFSSAPAMILFPYGNGTVFLSGPHPEIMFTNCQLSYPEKGWALMAAMLRELIN